MTSSLQLTWGGNSSIYLLITLRVLSGPVAVGGAVLGTVPQEPGVMEKLLPGATAGCCEREDDLGRCHPGNQYLAERGMGQFCPQLTAQKEPTAQQPQGAEVPATACPERGIRMWRGNPCRRPDHLSPSAVISPPLLCRGIRAPGLIFHSNAPYGCPSHRPSLLPWILGAAAREAPVWSL